MARIDVSFSGSYLAEFNTYTANVNPSEITLAPNDTLRITGGPFIGGPSSGLWETLVDSAWSNPGNGSVSAGQYKDLHVVSSPVAGVYYVNCTYGGASKNIKVNVVAVVDDYPDSFDIGSNISNMFPGIQTYLDSVVISGINTLVSASITNGEIATRYGGPWKTTLSDLDNGDRIYVRAFSPADYSQSHTVTLTIGSRQDSLTIDTNPANPNDSGTSIPINIVSPSAISMGDIGNLFGRGSNMKLGDYYKSGGLVPTIDENVNIPTEGEITLEDFYGCATKLYFTYPPKGDGDDADTTDSAKTVSVIWVLDTHFKVGFGSEISNNVEVKFTVTEDGDTGNGIVTDTNYSRTLDTWSDTLTGITISYDAPFYSEGLVWGTLTIHIRHKNKPSFETSETVSWSLAWHGP